MKSNKQRRAELKAKRGKRAAKPAHILKSLPIGAVLVDVFSLAPAISIGYGEPEFVRRGYYIDQPFECQTCGEWQVWKASQQKWWYEIAKGSLKTVAQVMPPMSASRASASRGCQNSSPGRAGKEEGENYHAIITELSCGLFS